MNEQAIQCETGPRAGDLYPYEVPAHDRVPPVSRAWEKWGYIANLVPTAQELDHISRGWVDDPNLEAEDLRILELMRLVST